MPVSVKKPRGSGSGQEGENVTHISLVKIAGRVKEALGTMPKAARPCVPQRKQKPFYNYTDRFPETHMEPIALA
jgi:hypothetical protein